MTIKLTFLVVYVVVLLQIRHFDRNYLRKKKLKHILLILNYLLTNNKYSLSKFFQ